MKLNKLKNIVNILLIVCLGSLFITRPDIQPAEQLDVEIALGNDYEKITDDIGEYIITRCVYVFEQGKKISSRVIISRGKSFAIARENRMQMADKHSISGIEKIYIFNESLARRGIRQGVDIMFKNPRVNDTGIFVVSKNLSSDIMKFDIPIYESSTDYIEGLIKNEKGMNFFPEEYDAMNIYVRLDSEGRKISLPYIEIEEDTIVLSGEAIFKEDKMVAKIDMEAARIMNILKYNNVKGILTIQKNSKEYIDFSAKSKRKIKCVKKDEKYNFIIDVKLQAEVITNTLNKELILSSDAIKEFEDTMSEEVKKQCNVFIGMMKKDLKVDCIELGRVAAAKYGRRKGIDWDEVVTDSVVDINVEVKLDKHGRGDF